MNITQHITIYSAILVSFVKYNVIIVNSLDSAYNKLINML